MYKVTSTSLYSKFECPDCSTFLVVCQRQQKRKKPTAVPVGHWKVTKYEPHDESIAHVNLNIPKPIAPHSQHPINESTFVHEYVAKHQPVVLKGLGDDWTALKEWKPMTFKCAESVQPYLDLKLDVAAKSNLETYFSGDLHTREGVEFTFGQLLDLYDAVSTGAEHWAKSLSADMKFYLCQCPIVSYDASIESKLPDLMNDITVPDVLENQKLVQINLWLTLEKSISNIHYDAHHNILTVLHGCKTVMLYPPSDTPALYPRRIYQRHCVNHSTVNRREPDAVKHPLFNQSLGTEYIVSEGDSLFIPEGWWHEVESAPTTIAVNFWFHGVRDTLQASPHMHEYYVRTILETLAEKERKFRLEKFRKDYQHNKSLDELVVWFDQPQSSEVVENIFLGLDWQNIKTLSAHLAMNNPSVWREILTSASPLLVEHLTEMWDSAEDPDMDAYYGIIFDDNEDLRPILLEKKDKFAFECLKNRFEPLRG